MSANRNTKNTILLFANIDPDVCNACTLHVAGLANGFAANGCRVHLVVPECAPWSELRKMVDSGIQWQAFPRARVPGLRTVWSLGTLLALPRLVRLMARRPNLLYVRDDQSTWLLHVLARLFGVHSLGEQNSLISLDKDLRSLGRMRAWLLDLCQRLDCRFAHRVRAVTEGVKAALVARGANAAKIFVVGNGSDLVDVPTPSREECLERLGLPHEKIYVGFLGHLVWWQGCDQLLATFSRVHRRLPHLVLILAGDGPMARVLRKMAIEHGVADHVHFLGPIPYERRREVIGAFDIACFTGTGHRNIDQGVSPLKIRDYAACGRAILAARLPGLEEMETKGVLELYTADDPIDLEKKLTRLAENEELRHELGARARHNAVENFGWALITRSILAHAT